MWKKTKMNTNYWYSVFVSPSTSLTHWNYDICPGVVFLMVYIQSSVTFQCCVFELVLVYNPVSTLIPLADVTNARQERELAGVLVWHLFYFIIYLPLTDALLKMEDKKNQTNCVSVESSILIHLHTNLQFDVGAGMIAS